MVSICLFFCSYIERAGIGFVPRRDTTVVCSLWPWSSLFITCAPSWYLAINLLSIFLPFVGTFFLLLPFPCDGSIRYYQCYSCCFIFFDLEIGLEVTEVAVSGLPMNPSAVWTVKRSTRDEHDRYIVVSSPNSTLVLAVGENVEEVHDSGFLGTTSTLVAINVGEDGLLQVFFFPSDEV
jgi:hypothetical protein